jgi:hypothetical protein
MICDHANVDARWRRRKRRGGRMVRGGGRMIMTVDGITVVMALMKMVLFLVTKVVIFGTRRTLAVTVPDEEDNILWHH